MLSFILQVILGKEGVEMMAMLFAQKIIIGTKTYADVPAKLKSQVAEILRESGLEDLVTE